MDKLPLAAMILYSIPESAVVCWFGLSLLGLRVGGRRLLLVAVAASLFSLAVRGLPVPYGVHTLAHLVFLVTALWVGLGVNFWHSLAACSLGFLGLGLLEMSLVPVTCSVSGLTLREIMASAWLRVAAGAPQVLLLAAAAWAVNRFDLRLTRARPRSGPRAGAAVAQRQALFLSLIALVSMQVLLVAGANFNAVVRTVFRIPASAPMTGAATLLVMVVAMVSVLVVARLLRLSEELAQHQADVENWRHVGELFRGMQAQRHDFLNHVQTLLGLLQLGRAQEAERYIQDVFADTTTLNTVSIPGQPSLMALLHAKMGSAAARGIAFDVRVLADPQRVQVPSHELNRILGNLLDNAFDAVEATERRTVSLSIEREQERVVFAVRNPGQLPATMPDRLCEAGFTSKGGSHLGMGLAIVCELVARNGGRFSLRQEQPDQVLARVDFPG